MLTPSLVVQKPICCSMVRTGLSIAPAQLCLTSTRAFYTICRPRASPKGWHDGRPIQEDRAPHDPVRDHAERGLLGLVVHRAILWVTLGACKSYRRPSWMSSRAAPALY